MKKLLLSCIAIVAIAFTTPMNAQQTVQTGAPSTYQTTGTLATSFEWLIDAAVQAPTINTFTYTWATPGSYVLSVIPISASSCRGVAQTLNVTVVNVLPVTLAMGAMSAICPLTSTMPAGGDPVSLVTVAGGVAGDAVSVSYTVDGGTNWLTATGTALSAGLTSSISFDANLANISGADQNVTVTIRNYTIGLTTYTPIVASQPTGVVVVNPAPSTTGIVF